MTATLVKLGKVFNGIARIATHGDMKILAPGDWVKSKTEDLCWHFQRWEKENCVATWEEQEFVIRADNLMVTEVLDNLACPKFFRSLDKRNLKETQFFTDYSQLKAGDRLVHHSTRNQDIHIHFATVISVEKGEIYFKREHNGCTDRFSCKELKEAGYSKFLNPPEIENWGVTDQEALAVCLLTNPCLSKPEHECTQNNSPWYEGRFNVGLRVLWHEYPDCIYEIVKPEKGGHVTIGLTESPRIKPCPPNRKRVALWEIRPIEQPVAENPKPVQLERRLEALKKLKNNSRYWDSQSNRFGKFVGGDKQGFAELIDDNHDHFTASPDNLCKANRWEGLKVRHINGDKQGVIDRWHPPTGGWWVIWDEGVDHACQDDLLIPVIEIGDKFAINPGVTQHFEVVKIGKGKAPYYIKWQHIPDEDLPQVDIEFFRKFKRLENTTTEVQSWAVTDEEAEALLNRKWAKPPSSKPTLAKDAPIAVVLFAGGGGIEAGMVEAGIRPLVSVEFDPNKPKLSSAIADCHELNFKEYGGEVIRKTVQEITAKSVHSLSRGRNLLTMLPRNPDFLHASPMCSNFSNAKAGDAIETQDDIDMAKSVADIIRYTKPKFFTLENVRRYRDSQSFKIIAQALDEEGYTWDEQVMTLLDCQARKRFIVRAAIEWLPPQPAPIQPVGWYQVIADLIPKMADSELVPGQKKALEEFLTTNEPTPLLIDRVGGRGEYKVKPASKPCNTLRSSVFIDQKGSNRNKFADIWLPNGTVKSVSIEAAARLQGFPDWYQFPSDTATAGSIIGYSVPPKFAAQLFTSLQQSPPIEVQIQLCQKRIITHNWRIENLKLQASKTARDGIKIAKIAIACEQGRIDQLLEELIVYRQLIEMGVDKAEATTTVLKLINS